MAAHSVFKFAIHDMPAPVAHIATRPRHVVARSYEVAFDLLYK